MKLTLDFKSDKELQNLCEDLLYLISTADLENYHRITLLQILDKFQDAIIKEKLK